MKRFFLFLLSAAMVLSLLGCGEKDPSQADRVPSTSAYAQYVEPWVRDVPQIAMDTGFSTSAYFTKVFQQLRGMTPSQYRKQQ